MSSTTPLCSKKWHACRVLLHLTAIRWCACAFYHLAKLFPFARRASHSASWERISRGLPRSASSQRGNRRKTKARKTLHQDSLTLLHLCAWLKTADQDSLFSPHPTKAAQIAPSMLGHHHYGLLNCIQSGFLLFRVVYSTSVWPGLNLFCPARGQSEQFPKVFAQFHTRERFSPPRSLYLYSGRARLACLNPAWASFPPREAKLSWWHRSFCSRTL